MRLVFLTKYSILGASSRYRSFLYFKYLKDIYDYDVCYNSFFNDNYLTRLYNNEKTKLLSILFFVFKRIYYVLFKIKQKDIVFIEYEIIPYFPSILEFYLKIRNIKYVLDYDDAIFHNYDINNNFIINKLLKNKIPNISKCASAIITGSSYLTNYFRAYNRNIFEIPTSIPFEYYHEIFIEKSKGPKTYIGWIGSKSTSVNLLPYCNLINEIIEIKEDVIFIFCGCDIKLKSIFSSKVIFLDWNYNNEKFFLSKVDVGIMPLLHNNFNKGKCGFKLVQYMAVGIPTISTPFQSNIDIDNGNGNLFAKNVKEWEKAFNDIIDNYEYYKHIGIKNRETIKDKYSIESHVFHIHKIINSIS